MKCCRHLLNEVLESNVVKVVAKTSESSFSALEARELMGVGWGGRVEEQKGKNFTLTDTASDQGINGTD